LKYVRENDNGGDGNDTPVEEEEEPTDLGLPKQSNGVEWYDEPVIFAPESPDALFASEHRFVLDLMEPLWEKQMDAMNRKSSSHKRGGSSGSFNQSSNSVSIDGIDNTTELIGSDRASWRT